MLLFIYYYKNLISINDIEQLLKPITEQHFQAQGTDRLPLADIYRQVFSLENDQMVRLKDDIRAKFDAAQSLFSDVEAEDQEYLRLFAFISELSFDVYLKKQMVEMMIDQLREEEQERHPSRKKG